MIMTIIIMSSELTILKASLIDYHTPLKLHIKFQHKADVY